MISFEHRLMADSKMTLAPPFRIMARSESPQLSDSSVCHWCNFCNESQDPTSCETFLIAKEKEKWKKSMPIVMAIKTEEISDEFYDVMI